MEFYKPGGIRDLHKAMSNPKLQIQHKFAAAMGVSQSTLWKLESGRVVPNVKTLCKVFAVAVKHGIPKPWEYVFRSGKGRKERT